MPLPPDQRWDAPRHRCHEFVRSIGLAGETHWTRFAPVSSHREPARANYAVSPRKPTCAGKAALLAHTKAIGLTTSKDLLKRENILQDIENLREKKYPVPAIAEGF